MKRRYEDRGSVSVEYALTLPLVVALIGMIAAVATFSVARIETCNQARLVANAAAVGESWKETPTDISVELSSHGSWVEVSARKNLGHTSGWINLPVTCQAKAKVPDGFK